MKRTAIKATKAPAERRSPQALRKSEADALFDREGKKRYALAGGLCERCHAAPATDRHHVVLRSSVVNHDVENLRCLCHACHMHIHDHPAESERDGWIVRSYSQLTG